MESSPKVTVAIKEHEDSEPGESTTWSLKFAFKTTHARLTFISHEPYMLTLTKWQQLMRGDNCMLDMYQGNGEGRIVCCDHMVTFTSNTSGAGGDTDMEYVISHEHLQEQLATAINFAIEHKYLFAPERK